jgi:chemotaxis protein CheZ
MNDLESMRRDIVALVEELRDTLQDIGDDGLAEANVVSNARDRLRYIASLTEQAAGRTLTAAEAINERLGAQRIRALALAGKTRSPEIRAFLVGLDAEHACSAADTREIIEAQSFQDLVGQVVGKLMHMVQRMEDNLVHLLVDDPEAGQTLAGPAVTQATRISQDDVDSLFG